MRFLAIGECMAELAPTAGPNDLRLGFAGDTFNTVWYLARIAPKLDVAYYTAVGDDAISQQMRDMFVDSGIACEDVLTVPNRTLGLYLITLDNGERSFTYWRGQSAARKLATDAGALTRAVEQADIVYFSGITLAILEPASRAGFLEAMRSARAAGKTIAFDPNLRLRLWESAEEMTRITMQGAEVSDIALPSFEDEAEWFGDADPAATAERYANAGATTIIVKNSTDDVHYRDADTQGVYPVAPVDQVVDTTAAGDSFNAGFFAALCADRGVRASVAQGCQLAGLVVQGKGALVPVDPEDLTQTA